MINVRIHFKTILLQKIKFTSNYLYKKSNGLDIKSNLEIMLIKILRPNRLFTRLVIILYHNLFDGLKILFGELILSAY
jgi:hypothetical protein